MKTLKGWIPTTFFVAVLVFGSTVANAGIITNVSGDQPQPCEEKVDNGIITNLTGIITNFTGIITNFTGIITNATGSDDAKGSVENCGIITN